MCAMIEKLRIRSVIIQSVSYPAGCFDGECDCATDVRELQLVIKVGVSRRGSVDLKVVFDFDPRGDRLAVFHGRLKLNQAGRFDRHLRKPIWQASEHLDMFDGSIGGKNGPQNYVAAGLVTPRLARVTRGRLFNN